jgi:autotransporter-associated beta strand protein
MKPKYSVRRVLPFPAMILAGSIVTQSARAASQVWDGGGADANWSTVTNWVGDPLAAPGDTASTTNTDVATFDAAIANTWGDAVGNPIVTTASLNLGGISFDTAAGNYFIGSTGGNPLLLSSGGTTQILSTLSATDALETINAPLVIQGADGTYTIANNSANGAGAGAGTLVLGGGITGGAAGATVLNLDGSNTNANTLGGIVANGTATTLGITKNGAGIWNLPAANSFTGPIVVNNGLLALGAMTIGVAQPLTLTGGTLSLGSGNGAVSLNTTATGSGTLALVGLGTKTLTSLGASYDGNITISASPVQAANRDPNGGQAVVNLAGIDAFGSAVGSTTITNTGTGVLFINHIPFATATPLAENFVINAGTGLISFGAGSAFDTTHSGNIQINSGRLLLNNGGYRTTHSGIISGPGGIAAINPASVLTGPNTFSGGYSLGLGATGWSGTYGITQGVTVGGSDTLSGGAILNGPLGTGTLTFTTATGTFNGTGRLADNGQALTTLHCNVIQRNGLNISSQPGGSVVVNNANTMIITDAGLTVPSTWTLKPCPNVYSNVAPDLALSIPGTNGSTLPLIMGMTINTLYTFRIDQVIGQDMGLTPGNMTLRKIGLGTLILGRVNTYGGDTMAMQGTLKLGTDDALPTGTKLAVGGGIYTVADWPELGLVPPVATPLGVNLSGNTVNGTFDLNGFNQTVAGIGQSSDSVTPANNIVTNSSATAVTFMVNNAVANSFGGTISGNLNLAKSGIGTLTQGVTAVNSYSGNTTVTAGTLSLASANAGNDLSSVIIASSATLDLNFAGTDTVDKLYIGTTPVAAGVYGPSATPLTQITGTGTLTVTTTGGALPALVANAGADKNVSAAAPSTMIGGSPTASGGTGSSYSYSWSPTTGLNNPTVANPTASPATTTTYTVTVDDGVSTTVTDSVVVTSISLGYANWASANAGGQAADLDYDGDGMPNGVEYFMGATGSTFTPNPPLVNTAGVLTVTWPRDPSAVATYKVQISDDLIVWSDVLPPNPNIDETVPTQVTYTLPSGSPVKFCRLVVTP